MRAYILLALLTVLVPASLFHPFWGILVWTWISYFNPQEFTFGFTRTLPVGFLVAIPTMVGWLFARKRMAAAFTKEALLVVVLWFWFLVTSLNVYLSPTFVHHLPDTLHKLEFVSKILLMQCIAVTVVSDAKRLRLWYLVTAGTFAFFALKFAIFGLLTGGQFRVYGPENSMIADNNDFGLAMNMALPMFACLSRTDPSPTLRWAFRVSILTGIFTVILSYSRGALVGLIVLMVMWFFKSRYKAVSAIGVVLAGLIISSFAPGPWIERMGTIRTAREKDSSAQHRLRSWRFATDLALDHPVFGGGFETFTVPLYTHYSIEETHGPHSIYFQVLAEHGVPGLLIFLALIFSCYWSCRKIIRQFAEEESCSYLAEYSRMVQLSLVAFLASGAFLGRAYFDLFYQLVATVVVLKCLAAREMAKLEDPVRNPDVMEGAELVGSGRLAADALSG